MHKQKKPGAQQVALDLSPRLYEIRVRGRLDSAYWAEWFDGMILTAEGGETVLRVPLTDQSALYGLLSRLRDLALPLVSVRELTERDLRAIYRTRRHLHLRVNWLLLMIYLLAAGALSSLTVFLTSDGMIDTALGLSLLFSGLGAIAYGFSIWDGGRGWLAITALVWPGAVITFIIYLTVREWLDPALAISILLLVLTGGVLLVVYGRRGKAHMSVSERAVRPLPDQMKDSEQEK